jgi:hypothetical protein
MKVICLLSAACTRLLKSTIWNECQEAFYGVLIVWKRAPRKLTHFVRRTVAIIMVDNKSVCWQGLYSNFYTKRSRFFYLHKQKFDKKLTAQTIHFAKNPDWKAFALIKLRFKICRNSMNQRKRPVNDENSDLIVPLNDGDSSSNPIKKGVLPLTRVKRIIKMSTLADSVNVSAGAAKLIQLVAV